MMSKKEKSQAVENFNVVLNSLVGSHKIDRREAVAMAAKSTRISTPNTSRPPTAAMRPAR